MIPRTVHEEKMRDAKRLLSFRARQRSKRRRIERPVQSAPLQAVIDEVLVNGALFEVLACGHRQPGRYGPDGTHTAVHRRCLPCAGRAS